MMRRSFVIFSVSLWLTAFLSSNSSAMYEPGSGRFCSRDPIGFEGLTPNIYEYVSSSPATFVDPYGFETTWIETLGKSLGLGVGGAVGFGSCGSFDAAYSAMGSWSYFLGKFKGNINERGSLGPITWDNCGQGTRCCHVLDNQVFFKARFQGAINNVRVQGLPFKPNVSVDVTVNANVHSIVGICLKKSCRCPAKIRTVNNIMLPDIVDGEMDYPPDGPIIPLK